MRDEIEKYINENKHVNKIVILLTYWIKKEIYKGEKIE